MIVKIWDIKFETSLFLCQSDSHDKYVWNYVNMKMIYNKKM